MREVRTERGSGRPQNAPAPQPGRLASPESSVTIFEHLNKFFMRAVAHHLTALAAFTILSILMTWPLAANLERSVAYPGDPYINAWILHWDYVATINQPLSLFHAPIFHPMSNALALSEHLYGIALFCFPLYAAGLGVITVYNLAMLAGFSFSGYAMYLLCRSATGSVMAAAVGGIFFAFNPWRFTHLSHLQHMWAGWLPLMLLAFLVYARTPRWRNAILFGAAFLMNGLTNVHWFVLGSTAMVITAALVPIWYPALRRIRAWLPIFIATIVAGLLLLPFLLPYRAVSERYGLRRDFEETRGYSAFPPDWFVSGFQNRLYGFRTNDGTTDPERWLFPGVLILALSAIGMIYHKTRPEQSPRPIATLWVAGIWLVLGVLGSFGLNFPLHRFLFEHIEVFRSIRVPARWAMIAYVGLAILGSMGAATILEILKRSASRIAGVGIATLMLFELRAAPIRWYFAPIETPEVYQWLDRTPISGALLELPVDSKGSEYQYLLRATAHPRRLMNGVSGFAPRHFLDVVSQIGQHPIPDSLLSYLERSGCSAILVHADALPVEQSTHIRNWLRRGVRAGRLTFVRRFEAPTGGDYLFAVSRSEPLASWWRAPETTDPAGRTPIQNLEVFFKGSELTYNKATFGFLDTPAQEFLAKGSLRVSGWALSPHDVKQVRLLFSNGRTVIDADLVEYPAIHKVFPWYPQTRRAAFRKEFAVRPQGIENVTDLQVEIIDGKGESTRLPHIWFDWHR